MKIQIFFILLLFFSSPVLARELSVDPVVEESLSSDNSSESFFVPELFDSEGVEYQSGNSDNYSVSSYSIALSGGSISSSSYSSSNSLLGFDIGTRNAFSSSFSSNIGSFNGTIPFVSVSIDSYEIYPATASPGSIIRFFISATSSQAVWLVLTPPSGVSQTINLTNNDYSYYTASSAGTYSVSFYANSSTGSLASVLTSFVISDSSTPSSSSSGGGGSSCTYVWDCSPWSICSSNTQVRSCKNAGSCSAPSSSKPLEIGNCSDSLFDVVLTLEDITIVEGDHPSMDIVLTQTKSTDKIDVQIMYTVTDSSSNQIFSLVETRAVDEELSFNKVLKELELLSGVYSLRVEILYGNDQKAYSEVTFRVDDSRAVEVLSKKSSSFRFKSLLIVLSFLLIGVIAGLVIARLVHLAKHFTSKSNNISEIIGKPVYSENGNSIGMVKESFISGKSVYGWTVKLNDDRGIVLIKQKDVISISNIMIVHGNIDDLLNSGPSDSSDDESVRLIASSIKDFSARRSKKKLKFVDKGDIDPNTVLKELSQNPVSESMPNESVDEESIIKTLASAIKRSASNMKIRLSGSQDFDPKSVLKELDEDLGVKDNSQESKKE
jgi:hypothetical protein